MSLAINILIVMMTFVITVIPITGNLTSSKDGNIFKRINTRGYLFILCVFLLFILGMVKEVDINIKDSQEEKREKNISSNVNELNTKFQSASDSIIKSLDNTRQLNAKLKKVDDKTLEILRERERLVREFEQINSNFKQAILRAKARIQESKPEILILENVKWVKIKGESDCYQIKTCFTNVGGRTAEEFHAVFFIFELAIPNNTITSHIKIPEKLKTNERIPPSEISNKARCIFQGIFNNLDEVNVKKDNMFILMVKYEYIDPILEQKHEMINYFKWAGFEIDNLDFREGSSITENLIEGYFEENRIEM